MITTDESINGSVFDVVSVSVTPVGGVWPPGGVPPPVGGAVGDSPLQAPRKTTIAATAIHDFRWFIVLMSNPHITWPAREALPSGTPGS